jgi:hypothetical protein
MGSARHFALVFSIFAGATLLAQTKPSAKKSDQSKSVEEQSEKIEETGRALRESKEVLKRGNVSFLGILL